MRILYVLHQFFPEFSTGTERVTLNLARMAQRAGHHVHVMACMLDPARHAGTPEPLLAQACNTVVDGVPVTLLDRATLPAGGDTAFAVDQRLVQQLLPWLRRERFDVVHLLHAMRMASVVAAVQRCGLPVVATLTDYHPACLRVNLVDADERLCDGPDEGRACARRCATPSWDATAFAARWQHGRALLASAAVRVAPSAFVAGRFRTAFPGLPVDVVAHGVDLLAIRRGRPADDAGVEPAAGAPLTIGFIGSLIRPKGLHVLLQALAAAPELPLRLEVAGAFHGDAVYEAALRALAAADPRVALLGHCSADEVARLVHRIELLCLPSLVPESFSLVVHECAAAGVPSLVSDLGAPAEHIRRDGGGGVVAAGDVGAWTQALRGWAGEPGRRAAWRAALRLPQRIEEEAFLYEGLYRQALAGAFGAASASMAANSDAGSGLLK